MALQMPSNIRPRYNADGKKAWYVVRIKTFSSAQGGINLCLINANDECVFKRLAPPFDRGMREEDFEAPDLGGEVVKCIAAPETGSWGLTEITINKKTFMYEAMIGGRDGDTELAAYMTRPQLVLTPEIKRQWDEEYASLKRQLTNGTLQLVAIGTAVTAVALGPEKAAAYAAGGGLAIAYAFLLEWEIDNIGKSRASYTGLRFAGMFAAAATLVSHFQDKIQQDNGLFVLALIGFMSYKASIARLAATAAASGHENKV